MKIPRRVFLSGITALVVLGVIGSLGYFVPAAAQGTGPQVQVDSQVLESLQGGKSADYVIVMAEQADLSAAYGIADWDERGWYVYNTLKETAARSQKRSVEQLKRHGVRYESFFAGNEIYVHGGSLQALHAVLELGDAASIRAPVTVTLEPAGSGFAQPLGPAAPKVEQQAELQSEVDWGINDTGAPDFWSAYGRQGQGIIVANIDTGVQYNHPALAAAYRCADISLPTAACWYDATNPATMVPYDDQGHGTHTMGTMVGSNSPSLAYSVGMAPGAKWIACKAFIGDTATNLDLEECADWILVPNGNPSNRPHIVNNSWGDDESNAWFQGKVQAWKAAGIFPVFSAGNSGSAYSCSNIFSPADYIESFTVTAHDSSRNIASFSSKGPLTNYFGSTPYLKPNISAPGVSINSSVPNNGWAINQGTSMAAPHVSGAVALLWSCNPYLVGKIDLSAAILEDSADPSEPGFCTNPPGINGDSTYGHGFLNVYAAGITACGDWFATYLPLITNNFDPNLPPDPIQNGGFESGRVMWSEYSSNNYSLIMNSSPGIPVHTGSWVVWLGGANNEISSISQTVSIPVGRSILHYWYFSVSYDICKADFFEISVAGYTPIKEIQCESNDTRAWVHRTLDLTAYAGTTQTLTFYVSTDSTNISHVFLDDISLETSASVTSINENPSGTSIEIIRTKDDPQR